MWTFCLVSSTWHNVFKVTYAVKWSGLHSLSWPNNIPLYDYTKFCLSINQLMGIWVICTFAIMNNLPWTWVQISAWTYVFNSIGGIPKRRIARSYGSYVYCFWKTDKFLCQSSYTLLHYTQKYMKVLISSHLHQHLLANFWF